MAKDGDTASFQDVERTTQQSSSDVNRKFTGSSYADQNYNDINIKHSKAAHMSEQFAIVTTSVAKGESADTMQIGGYESNTNNWSHLHGLQGTDTSGVDDENIHQVIFKKANTGKCNVLVTLYSFMQDTFLDI